MARGKNRVPRTDAEKANKAAYREAVTSLQRTAYWNLRTRLANVSIVIGALALMAVLYGAADGARLIPTLTCTAGGLCGAAVYFSRPYPLMTRWLLIASVGLTALGLAGLAIMVGAGR